MASDSPLVLSLHLRDTSLSLTIVDTCGLSLLHTSTVHFANLETILHLENTVSALDAVLEQAAASAPLLLNRVRAVATTAESDVPVFLTPSAPSILSSLSSHERLEPQLRDQAFFVGKERFNEQVQTGNIDAAMIHSFASFSMQDTPTATLGAQRYISSSNGAPPSVLLFPSQICRIAKSPVWDLCGHIIPIGTLLDSLLLGQMAPCNPTQASSTSLFDSVTFQWDFSIAQACSQGNGLKLLSMLPSICALQNSHRVGPWLVKRFGFSSDCVVFTSLPSLMTGYTSFLPFLNDGGILFDTSDTIIVPVQNSFTSPHHSVLVNPLYLMDRQNARPWLAVFRLQSAGHARCSVRDTYTKTWNAFNQLVQAVCPGGSVGLDNKLFTLFVTSGPHTGLRRFEHGTRVAEFFDLRANPRCVIEGQALHIRKILSLIKWQDQGSPDASAHEYRGAANCLSFDPLDTTLTLPRWYTWGRAAGNERIAEVYAQVLGAPIMADEAGVRACEEGSEKSTSSNDQVTRPSWGACLIAACLLEQGGKTDPNASIQTCIDLLKKRVWKGVSHRSLLRKSSTLACVEEDEGDMDISENVYTLEANRLCPAASARPRRSLTVSLMHSTSSPSPQPRERSSTVTSTSLLSVTPSSPRQEDTSSLPTSPQECLTHSPSLIQQEEGPTPAPNGSRSIQMGEPDEDLWQFYGSLLEEYIRLSDMVEETLYIDQRLSYL